MDGQTWFTDLPALVTGGLRPASGLGAGWFPFKYELDRFAGQLEEAESGLPPLWWGLWIVTNIIGWVAIQLGGASETPLEGFYVFDLVGAAINVGLCLVLVRLMGRLAAAQRLVRHAGVFA